jgi:hypothetical protein
MPYTTKHVMVPHSNAKMNTLGRGIRGLGYGTVLLDGGKGGQSSYSSIDNYIETTGRNPYSNSSKASYGSGLADKISHKLKNLNIEKPPTRPKAKNITMSI